MVNRADIEAKINSARAFEGNLQAIQYARQATEAALRRYDTAVAAGQPAANLEPIAQEIDQLIKLTQLAIQGNRPQKPWTRQAIVGIAALVLIFVVIAILFLLYVSNAGIPILTTNAGIRPILVIAIIISTVIFGGSLLLGSLFSTEGTFEDRFRRAREIFLVFAGVFGTVLGFYFGAAESTEDQLSVIASLEDTTVVAYTVGGTPPYEVTVTYGPRRLTKTQITTTGFTRFSFNKATDNIIPLIVSATDNEKFQGSWSVDLTEAELKRAGWTLPEAPTTGTTQPITPTLTLRPRSTVAPMTITAPITGTLDPISTVAPVGTTAPITGTIAPTPR